MGDDLYGLSGGDVERLSRMLADYEGTALKTIDPPSERDAPACVETYLAITTDTITALVTTTITRTGDTTDDSAVVTSLSTTADLTTGMTVTGTGIPDSTIISTIDSGSQVTLSQLATASGSPSLTFESVIMGEGPVEIFGGKENENGEYGLLDALVEEVAYNLDTSTIPIDTKVQLLRDPYSGRLVVVSGTGSSSTTFSGATTSNTTTTTSPDETDTVLDFSSVLTDTDAYWDNGDSTKLTVPSDGHYLIGAQIDYGSAWIGQLDLKLRRNGAFNLAIQGGFNGSTSFPVRQNVSVVRHLSAGDYVEAVLYQNNAGGFSNTVANGYMWIARLGD